MRELYTNTQSINNLHYFYIRYHRLPAPLCAALITIGISIIITIDIRIIITIDISIIITIKISISITINISISIIITISITIVLRFGWGGGGGGIKQYVREIGNGL